MLKGLEFHRPFPSRRAAESLRDQVVDYLLGAGPMVGDRFPTEAELVDMTGLSRSTIRRGLELLRKEGWVQSRAGSGTIVGPKVAMLSAGSSAQPPGLSEDPASVVRLAIVVFEIGDFLSSWYWHEIITGIDELAERCHVSLELIGGLNGSLDSIQRRLERGRPHLIACMGAEPRHVFILRMAEAMNIPCAVVGTTTWESGGIKLCEDNAAIVKTAIDHLAGLGHRRIALAIGRYMHGWVFERHKAFYDAMRANGLDVDEQLVHWLEHEHRPELNKPDLQRFIERYQPTAILSGSFAAMDPLAMLIRERAFSVPDKLSIVSIDQQQDAQAMISPLDLTRVELPLRQFGRKLAELAASTGTQDPLPKEIKIAGILHVGTTTSPLRS